MVDKRVLIRAGDELLVETVVARLRIADGAPALALRRRLSMWDGSGCIAIVLAKKLPTPKLLP